ncbi:prepilin-type N-terminal cleavage/methylation domain-containing protein [Campylobacter suis]|uniref:Prepilin-type N-terminal cleavage/methylation domain-containing protein n=1 Tax=Campylobacter suis TaxID=2790657 RepID=A0ABM8Q191_9BACT|nr:prepilin-type N-terminal cleavage/methylation domain-containing protein [Campylobacter suis]CAD7286571.1 hypothetical protein LMG8286_00404 [Campylobacter suis]
MRRAFSLIEIVLVVVIIAIMATAGINLLLVLYKNYSTSERMVRLELQSQNVLEYIGKLLAVRIPESAVAKEWGSDKFLPLLHKGGSDYDTLEFVAYTPEAFFESIYSGFADLQASTKQTIKTPLSKLTKLDSVIGDLNPKFGSDFELAVIFKSLNYNASDFGYSGKTNLDTAKIKDDITFELGKRRLDGLVSEHYHIAHTAYAIRVVPSQVTAQNELVLYFNYRPWLNESAKDGESAVLAKNVSTFVFGANDGSIRLKLCLSNQNLDTLCKSKVVQ